MDDPLLSIGRNGSLDLLHGEDHVLLVLCDLGEKREDEHVDGAGTLPVEGGGMVAIAGGNEGRDHLAQMLARQAGDAKVRLSTPFAGHVFLKRGVQAFEDAADTHLRIARHIQLGKRFERAFPKPGPDLLQAEDNVE